MQLTPRYGSDPIIRVDGFGGDPVAVMNRQRARLAQLLAGLDDDQWRSPSRCEGWTVQDVIVHLTSTNQFWAFSIALGLAGKPTTFLASFDPVSGPAELVAAAGVQEPAETLAAFVASNDALADAAAAIGDATWTAIGEAPPGHLSLGCVTLHALWDSLVHERDIALPLGVPAVVEPAEVAAALTYAAALSPAFLTTLDRARPAVIDVRASDPALHLAVEVADSVVVRCDLAADEPPAEGAVELRGDATALLEALSRRAPFDFGVASEDRWLFEGLATVFDE